jgi:hypothetical protein
MDYIPSKCLYNSFKNTNQLLLGFEACKSLLYVFFYRVFEYTSDAKPQTSLLRCITSELTL